MKLFIRNYHLQFILIILFVFVCFNVKSQDTIQNDGFYKFNYPNGKISSEGTIKNGKPDGYWKSYNNNETIKNSFPGEIFFI